MPDDKRLDEYDDRKLTRLDIQRTCLDFKAPVGDPIPMGACLADPVHGEVTEAQAEAHARRVAALWNACRGVTTEQLESGIIRQLVLAANGVLESGHPCDRCVEDECQAFGGTCDCRCHAEVEQARENLQKMVLSVEAIITQAKE